MWWRVGLKTEGVERVFQVLGRKSLQRRTSLFCFHGSFWLAVDSECYAQDLQWCSNPWGVNGWENLSSFICKLRHSSYSEGKTPGLVQRDQRWLYTTEYVITVATLLSGSHKSETATAAEVVFLIPASECTTLLSYISARRRVLIGYSKPSTHKLCVLLWLVDLMLRVGSSLIISWAMLLACHTPLDSFSHRHPAPSD